MRLPRALSLLPGALVLAAATARPAASQGGGGRGAPAADAPRTLIIPQQVWTGVDSAPHPGWVVLVAGNRIEAVCHREAPG